MPTLEQFLAGAPLPYRSFNGRHCVARWHSSPLGHIIAAYADGSGRLEHLAGREEAARFYRCVVNTPVEG